MNSKTVLWSTLALLVIIPSIWFSWSIYQRSENEKILNSVSVIMAEPNNDAPINIEALKAKVKAL